MSVARYAMLLWRAIIGCFFFCRCQHAGSCRFFAAHFFIGCCVHSVGFFAILLSLLLLRCYMPRHVVLIFRHYFSLRLPLAPLLASGYSYATLLLLLMPLFSLRHYAITYYCRCRFMPSPARCRCAIRHAVIMPPYELRCFRCCLLMPLLSRYMPP